MSCALKLKRLHQVFVDRCMQFGVVSSGYYAHPTGFFPASAVRHAWFPVFSRKSIYPMFTKFGMGVYWVNSLHGIAFGEDSSIAN